ncbi:MAG: CDP-glycerol glycerophosphotransferase family protein [Candidatus Hodarchaeales archaeon]
MTRKKIMFIPVNSRSAEVIAILKRDPIFSVDFDFFVLLWLEFIHFPGKVTNILRRSDINFEYISTYQTRNSVKILKSINPDIIIIFNDQSMIERSFIIAGKYMGIPSLYLQESSVVRFDQFNVKTRVAKYLYLFKQRKNILFRYMYVFSTSWYVLKNPIKFMSLILKQLLKDLIFIETRGEYDATLIATTGLYEYALFRKKNIPKEKLRVVGNPRFDIKKKTLRNKNDIFQEIGYKKPPSKQIVILATQTHVKHGIWFEWQREAFLRKVLNVHKKVSETFELIIKLHPGSNREVWFKLIRKIDKDIKVVQNMDIDEIISISDIYVTLSSTSALQAMIQKKPIILINFFNDPEYIPYASKGAAIRITSETEYINMLIKLKNDVNLTKDLFKNQGKFIYEFAYKIDGNTTRRVKKAIESLF